MKFETVKEKIYSVISKAEKVTSKNLSLPVLSCILLEVKDNQLIVKATNLDLGIEMSIPVKMESAGLVAIPGSILSSFISSLPNDELIKFEVKDGNLSVVSKNSRAVIKAVLHDDFPNIPKIDEEVVYKLSGLDVVKGFKSVWYSASVSSMKPELSSVCVYGEEENLCFVATDSFRLAEKKIRVSKLPNFSNILIPFKNVSDILRILDDGKGEVELRYNKNQLSIVYNNNTYITSRVIDGLFPDYKQIIPKESKTEIIVLKQDLINSLKLSNIFSDTFNQINLKVSLEDKALELKTKNSSVGENQNKIDGSITGEAVEMNFNYKYIVDCFNSVDSDSVSLSFNGMAKPLVIRGVKDKSFTYIVMPMNR